ncbi:MAG: Ni/Fe hydrogenase subunit alpha [Acidobacteria bacterium]|nr:Ni/Fe hydrogenase subunit alpha [Acidobacteriota bacterium]
MAQRILINPVSRIEGHAKVSIFVDDHGKVQSTQLHIAEFRGFEKICVGRPFHEMPGLMSRVCGICPVSHIVASAKACDELLSVAPPLAAVLQRRLINDAQLLQSHALSFFHLSSPDLLLGFDAPPESRNVFGVLEKHPDLARRGIRLRQFGQTVIERITGKRIHPNWGAPGGVLSKVSEEMRDELLAWIPEARETCKAAMDLWKGIADRFTAEAEHMGKFDSLFLATVDDDGVVDYYNGKLRIVDAQGAIVADGLDPKEYYEYIGEACETYSFMKFPYYKPLGYPAGMYRVGPLARLNVATSMGTPWADAELAEFKQRGTVNESFAYHPARLVEMIGAAERIERILEDPELLTETTRSRAFLNRQEGVGASEAPRGTLFHHYRVDSNGLMEHANLLIATANNNLAMQRAVQQTAEQYVLPQKLEEGMLNRVEAVIRCYDPCLSCSTHALGQMPLILQLHSLTGEIIDEVRRM